MNGTEQKQKMFLLASLYRVSNLFLGLFLVFMVRGAYALESDCELLAKYAPIKVEQGVVPELIFGKQRRKREITLLTELNNIIYKKNISYDDYLKIKGCLFQFDSRFLRRNQDVILMDFLGRVTDMSQMSAQTIRKERLYIEQVLSSGDNYEVFAAIGAVLAYRDDMAVDQLTALIVATDEMVLISFALSALHTIGSDYAYEHLMSLKKERPDLISHIEEYLDR